VVASVGVAGVRGFDAGVVLVFKFPKLKPAGLGVSAVAGIPKLKPADVAGLLDVVAVVELGVPNRPPLAGAEGNNVVFTGAGVEAGVVDAGLVGSGGLGSSSKVSMSVSLDMGVSAIGALAALSRALPKLPPKNEFPVPLDASGSLPLADLSALNVDPRLKGLEPKRLVGLSSTLLAEVPNGEPVFIAEPVLGVPKRLEGGFDPNTLPVEVGAAAANPPPDANDENPPEVGAAVVGVLVAPDPKTEGALPNPEGWPKAEPVEAAEPHGDGRLSPGRPELPNAGVDVEPNAGVDEEVAGFEPNAELPNAGAGVEAAGCELKADDPNVGALLLGGVEVEVEGVPHTDVR
jgi:hypothetical protein